jgi:hypothetical protein
MKKAQDASAATKSEQPVLTPRQERLPLQHRPSPNSLSSSGHAVELRIEELVLHGFPAGDRYRIGEALERELARLLTGQGAPPSIAQGGELARLDGGAFELQPDADAETIGAQLAIAIYEGLNR